MGIRKYEKQNYNVFVLLLMGISLMFLPIQAYRIKKRLLSFDKELWLNFGWQFNFWEFPIQFYDLIPFWYRYGCNNKFASKLLCPMNDEIRRVFTEKEQLRYHNVFKGKKTDEEFEFWFSNRIKNNNDYYYMRYEVDKIKWWEKDVYKKLVENELVSDINQAEKNHANSFN